MVDYHRQRGSLMIITIVMILVLSFLGVAITFLSVTSTHNAVDELAANEVLFLAESGLERGIKQWSLAPSTYAGEGPVNFGNGSFTVTTPVILSATQARISSSATITTISGSVNRTIEAIANLGGPPISEPMTDLDNWEDPVLTNNQGKYWIAGGVFRVRTDNKNGDTYSGYRETDPTSLIFTLSAGQSINLDLEYKKKCNNAVNMDMAVEMVDTTGISYIVWSETTIFNNNSWLTAPTTTWTVPAGVTVNRLRLSFNLEKDGNGCKPDYACPSTWKKTAMAANLK